MNSSKIFSKKVQAVLLSVGMVLYSLMPGVLAAQSNWVPPTGPPPNNNAPLPVHQGVTGQAKYYNLEDIANFTLGAFILFAEGLIGRYGIFDGPGVVASKYCFGDVGNFSSFPGNVDSLSCMTEDDYLALSFLINNGGDGDIEIEEGSLLPDGEFGKQLLYWDVAESAWLPMPTTFANVTDNSTTISMLSDANRVANFLVRGVSLLLNTSGGEVSVNTEGVTVDTGSYGGDFFLRLGTGSQPVGSVPVVLDELGRLGWSDEFSGGNLPDGSYYNEMLRWDLATSSWIPMKGMRIAYSGQGTNLNWIIGDFQNQAGSGLNSSFVNMISSLRVDPALRGNGNPGSSLFNVDMQSITISSNDLKIQPYAGFQEPAINPGDVLVAVDDTGKVGWGEVLPEGPDDDSGSLLVWDGNLQEWKVASGPLKILTSPGTIQNGNGEFEGRPAGAYFTGPLALDIDGETDAVAMSPNIPAAFARFPLAQGSNNVLSYQNSKLGQFVAGGGLGQGQTDILQGGSVVVDSPLIVSTIPYASDGSEELGLVRPLCYEVLFGSNDNPNPANWSGLLVDCESTIPSIESGNIIAVGARNAGQFALDWATQRAVNIEPLSIEDSSRIRYVWSKPPLVNNINVVACGSGGGGGGGSAGKPGNSNPKPTGAGGAGGSEGNCTQQAVSVTNVTNIEILVGNGGNGGAGGIHWANTNGTSGHIPAQNGGGGHSTIINFLDGNGTVVNTITVNGGVGGGKGFFQGESPTLGDRAAGGRSGALVADGVTAGDGYLENATYSNNNGGSGTVEIDCVGTPESCNIPIPSSEDIFNTLGWVANISGAPAGYPGNSAIAGKGGAGRQASGIPTALSGIGDGGTVFAPFGSGSTPGEYGGWAGGGGGGSGFTIITNGVSGNFPGWLTGTSCQNLPGSYCAPGGFGGRGGPGFVQLSW